MPGKTRLRNDLFRVEWDVRHCSLTPYQPLISSQCQLTGTISPISGNKFCSVNTETKRKENMDQACNLSSWREQLKGRFRVASDLITDSHQLRFRVSEWPVRARLASWVVWQLTTCLVLSVCSRAKGAQAWREIWKTDARLYSAIKDKSKRR